MSPFLGPVSIYLVGCLVTLMATPTIGNVSLILLFALGAGTSLSTWRLLSWPDESARHFSLGAVLLLMCGLNRVFYAADILVSGTRFDEWPFPVNAPGAAIFRGEMMTVLGTLVTVKTWHLAGGMDVSPSVVTDRSDSTSRVLIALYLMSIVGLAASQTLVAVVFGQALPVLLGLGSVSAFLLPLTRFSRGLVRLAIVIVLSAPFAVLASGTGMKENIIIASFPAAILAWRYFRHLLLRVGMILAGLLCLGVLTAYVNFFRDQVWSGKSDATNLEVMQAFVDEMRDSGLRDTASRGLASFVARSNASTSRGWAVSIADEQEFQPDLVFSPLIYLFVPRVLWPGKPSIREGWEFSGLVFGESYIAWSDSSTAAGFYTSLYLGYGWLALAAGAVSMGLLLAGTTRFARWVGGPIVAGLFTFAMLPFVLRLDETWAASALAGPVINVAYVLAIVMTARLAAAVIPRPHPSVASAE